MVVPVIGMAFSYSQQKAMNPYSGAYINAAAGLGAAEITSTLYSEKKAQLASYKMNQNGRILTFGGGYHYALSPKFLIGAGIKATNSNMNANLSASRTVLFVKYSANTKMNTGLSYLPYIDFGYVYKKMLFDVFFGRQFATSTASTQLSIDDVNTGNPIVLKSHMKSWLVGLNLEQMLTPHIHLYESAVYSRLPDQTIDPHLPAYISEVKVTHISTGAAVIGLSYTF